MACECIRYARLGTCSHTGERPKFLTTAKHRDTEASSMAMDATVRELPPRTMNLPDIAFIGGMGVGKTTCAEVLTEFFGYGALSFADPLKDVAASIWGQAARQDRDKLQRLGVAVRAIDEDAWARLLMDDYRTARATRPRPARFVVDDCRFPNEHQMLAEAGFVFVEVRAPRDMRVQRLLDNGKLQDEAQLDDITETSLDVRANYWLSNDGPKVAVAKRVVDILNREARRA